MAKIATNGVVQSATPEQGKTDDTVRLDSSTQTVSNAGSATCNDWRALSGKRGKHK